MSPGDTPMRPNALPIVYLVDDEAVVRDALAWLLRSRRIVSEPFDSAEAFEHQKTMINTLAWRAAREGQVHEFAG